MTGNRKRHTNTVQVGSLLKWVVIAVVFGIVGLRYVYLSNQLQTTGNEISKLEKTFHDLQVLNKESVSRVALLSSHKELQRRLTEGFISRMVPITDDHIVRINVPQHSADEIRAVANPGAEK